MRLLSQFHIMPKVWKFILSGSGAFHADCNMSIWDIIIFIISVWMIPVLIYVSGPMLRRDFGNTNLYTRAFFSFIDRAIFFLRTQSAGIVLDLSSFVDLRVVQYRFWFKVWADHVKFSFFFCRKFCQIRPFAFWMVQ